MGIINSGTLGDSGSVTRAAAAAKLITDPSTITESNFRDGLGDIIDTLVNLASASYPVGAIFTTTVAYADSAAVAAVLGGTTWAAFGSGKVLVGVDAAQTEFDTVEETGGSKTHTLSASEMPAHTHSTRVGVTTGGATPDSGCQSTSGEASSSFTSTSAGSGGAHNNLQPYITVYMWKRTA